MAAEHVIAGGEQIFRNRTNRISGILLQFMLPGVWILTDPLELRGKLPEGQGFGAFGVLLVAIPLGLLALASLAVWSGRWHRFVRFVCTDRDPLESLPMRQPGKLCRDVDLAKQDVFDRTPGQGRATQSSTNGDGGDLTMASNVRTRNLGRHLLANSRHRLRYQQALAT
jgi:hypothetical protein